MEKGQTIAVNYLGQVYDGKKPFDESYSAAAGLVRDRRRRRGEGLGRGLVGQTVGSRVVLEIPPDGYGKEGNQDAGIKPAPTRSTSSSTSSPRPDRHAVGRIVSMAAEKSERLLNLLIMLLVQRRYIAKDRIRELLYPDSTDEAFEKMFERDKEELRASACRSRSASSTPTSTTSPATGSGPTSSRCPRSS